MGRPATIQISDNGEHILTNHPDATGRNEAYSNIPVENVEPFNLKKFLENVSNQEAFNILVYRQEWSKTKGYDYSLDYNHVFSRSLTKMLKDMPEDHLLSLLGGYLRFKDGYAVSRFRIPALGVGQFGLVSFTLSPN